MNSDKKRWILLAISALSIGSTTAISELIITRAVDNLLPNTKSIDQFSRPGTITLLSTNGKIIQKIGPATREKIKIGEMPTIIKKAFIAAEDRRFYLHKGVDLWSICRAIINNLRQRRVEEGASTITQQLARLVFLNQEKTLIRKIKEASLAYKLERTLTKDEILEQYLNNVYLGAGAYGVSDAAWVYFSKSPELLNLSEAALIAGLAPAPSLYSPLVNSDLAIKRRLFVLRKMLNEGFISKGDFKKANIKKLNLNPEIPKYLNSAAPFFSSWVYKKLPDILTKEQLELGGISIRTSLNLEWQSKAEKIIKENYPEDTEGAIVSIEPSTGLIRVMVGGKNFNNNQFNRATQAFRSPGSTFKIFVYAAALKEGYKPTDLFIDTPKCWYGYCPKNFGDKYNGEISLEQSLKLSSNTIAVELLEKVGFEKVIQMANKLGVGKEIILENYFPLAIGAYGETVLNMTAAYAGIANKGNYFTPNPFEEIIGPENNILLSSYLNTRKGAKAVEPKIANMLNSMLKAAVEQGTGRVASIKGRAVAGKTGTSEGNRDLWFIGSIPQLTTGVWFGHDDNKKTNSSSGNAALAWKKFMESINNDFQEMDFEE